MIVALRPGCRIRIPGPVPQRRRVVIVGATEAGVSAAFHLGASAVLIEKRGICGAAPAELFEGLETRLGTCVTAIDVRERRLELSTGEIFVYDKLMSALPTTDLQRFIAHQLPTRVQSMEALRYWLTARDIELLDGDAQTGKRMAEALRRALESRYSSKPLFQPRVVRAD
jgi:glycine/D-amino acid oxidase-like deaminating enzyme